MDDSTIAELKAFFAGILLPDKIEIYPGTTIVDIPLFLKTQFTTVENGSSVVQRPAFERLVRLRELLSNP